MPPPPRRRSTRYRLPVTWRSCVTSSSGFSGFPARSGSVEAHREQLAAELRFQVPQSGQNTSGSELEADEIVRRPWTGERNPQRRMTLLFVRDRVSEFLPQFPLHEVGRAHDVRLLLRPKGDTGDGASPEGSYDFGGDRGVVRAHPGLGAAVGTRHVNARRHPGLNPRQRVTPSRIAEPPSCSASMYQNACSASDQGMCAKFIPHIPLTTTNGMLIVATTESALVISPRLLETCVR